MWQSSPVHPWSLGGDVHPWSLGGGAAQQDYRCTVVLCEGEERQIRYEQGKKSSVASLQDSLARSVIPKMAWSCLVSNLEHQNIIPTCKNSIPALQWRVSGCKKWVRVWVLRRNIFRSCFAHFSQTPSVEPFGPTRPSTTVNFLTGCICPSAVHVEPLILAGRQKCFRIRVWLVY